jgi:glutaredoxin 3
VDGDRRGAGSRAARGDGAAQRAPQIFVGERHVGGFDDLAALERAGELDALLAG